MDPLSGIVAALIAGATAAASDTASKAVKDAYEALKTILIDSYKIASAHLLEKKPSNPVYKQAVEDELKATPQIESDKIVLEKAEALRNALRSEPPEQLAKWGIDVKRLEAGGSIIAERVDGGIRGEEWKAQADVRLTDISAGPPRGKP